MKNSRNIIIWIRNIFAILTIVSGTYVIGKVVRVWMLYITKLDTTLIVGFIVILYVFIILNKKCKKWF